MPFVNMSPAVMAAQVLLTTILAVTPYAKSRFAYMLLCTLGPDALGSPLSLLPVALPLYASWFYWWARDLQHLRVHTAVNDVLWGVYDLSTGLAIAGITDLVTAGIAMSAWVVRRRTRADAPEPLCDRQGEAESRAQLAA